MSQPVIKVTTNPDHPLWIPGQPVPLADFRIMQRDFAMSRIDSSDMAVRKQKITCGDVWDLFSECLKNYQSTHIAYTTPGFTYFPFAFQVSEGDNVQDTEGNSFYVTTVLENRSGGSYHNAGYNFVCGQVVKLDPEPDFDTVLRLPRASEVYMTQAFPGGTSEGNKDIQEFLERTQFPYNQGFAMQLVDSRPWRTNGDVGMKERFGRKLETRIRDPRYPGYLLEAQVYSELTTYEFVAFGNANWVPEQLVRYLHTALRIHLPTLRERGLDSLSWDSRGPNDHLTSGERWPYKSDLYMAKSRWLAKTEEVVLTLVKEISKASLKTPITLPRAGMVSRETGQPVLPPGESSRNDL